jgi:hypothetical protein
MTIMRNNFRSEIKSSSLSNWAIYIYFSHTILDTKKCKWWHCSFKERVSHSNKLWQYRIQSNPTSNQILMQSSCFFDVILMYITQKDGVLSLNSPHFSNLSICPNLDPVILQEEIEVNCTLLLQFSGNPAHNRNIYMI